MRTGIRAAFANVDAIYEQRKQTLAKRRTEHAHMCDRLLNGYLAGTIEEATFQAKTADLKRQLAEAEESLDQANGYEPDAPARALAVFEFSQSLVATWERSNSEGRREVLDCVSLNRTVSDTTLCVTKRRPFDYLAERPFLKIGRGDWRSFEPYPNALAPFTSLFLGPPEPHLLAASRIAPCLTL